MTTNNLNMVTALVKIAGKNVPFVSLELSQAYGDHHHFSITLDHDYNGNGFMQNPSEQMDLIGRFAYIQFQHGKDYNNGYLFKGIITQLSMTGKDGKKGYLVVSGSSPTIMLERGRRIDIYSDMTLRGIFTKTIDGVFSDYMKCLNEPTYANKIEFVMQYNETDWDFLKRLAYLYGENLFYSGTEILFGAYEEWKAIQVSYDKEITDIVFQTKMLPNSILAHQYLADQDQTLDQASPASIENSNDYLDTIDEHNQTLTMDKPAKNSLSAGVNSSSELAELLKRQKSRTAAQTISIVGRAKTFYPTIGRLINIQMPEGYSKTNNLGTYRVIKSIHRIDERLHYSNEFEAVPASLTTMPVAEPKMPVAESVMGKVRSNEDPKGLGRVQVDFSFANQYCRIWMRVMSPNAGSSDQVSHNRGFLFVPEKGDQVMVGFEYGDTTRPYVMGSMFHGKNGKGGEQDNHLKTIITRQGHTIEFDDAADTLGITIKDKNGNSIHLDTKGKNIEITAPETIRMKAKNMEIDVEEDIKTNVGKNIHTNVGKDFCLIAQQDIKQDSGKKSIFTSGTNTEISANKDLDLYGRKQLIGYTDGNTEFGAKDRIHVYGGNSLITAKNKIEQKAPSINEVPQAGQFIYNKDPQIVGVKWMNEDMTEELFHYGSGDILSLLVETRNYKKGDQISVIVEEENGQEIRSGVKELTITGFVDEDGFARLQSKIITEYNKYFEI